MTVKHDSSRAAVVDQDYFWRKVGADTPQGAKVQLINRYMGVAVYGSWSPSNTYWTHWCPLPKFKEEQA